MRDFYTRNSDSKKFRKYKTISNGIILTKFDEKTGTPIVNEGYQVFVTKEELKNSFTPFEFTLQTSDKIDSLIVRFIPDFVYQLKNYGLLETDANSFEEFISNSNIRYNTYKEMVKLEKKAEFKELLLGEEDYWEYGEAEDLFNFICGGLIPIVKKILIELEDKDGQASNPDV